MRKAKLTYFVLAMATLTEVGCAKWLGELRRDLDDSSGPMGRDMDLAEGDDEPTRGGNWSERGYLDKNRAEPNRYEALGHMERGPASENGNSRAGDGPKSWISSAQSDANVRDRVRESMNEASLDETNGISSGTVQKVEPEKKRLYRNGTRVTRDDFVDHSQEEGSLWASGGQTNYYFTKNKIRVPGELVTLNIEADLYRDIGAEVKRTLSPKEKFDELEVIQQRLRTQFFSELEGNRKDQIGSSAAAPERPPAETTSTQLNAQGGPTPAASAVPPPPPVVSTPPPDIASTLTREQLERLVPRASFSDVDIMPSLTYKAGDKMMGEILERYPNGNYKIRTVKKIAYSKGPARLVSVVGIVKAADIAEDTDVINSGKLYEYRVEVSH